MVRGSLWCVLDGWASEAANLMIFLLLARLLGPEAFGLVALGMVFTTVATDLGGYAIARVLVQLKELPKQLIDSVFSLILAISATATAAFFLAAPWIAVAFAAPELETILRYLSITCLLNAVGAVPLSLLSRDLRFDAIAKRSLLMIAGGGIAGVGLALAGAGPFSLVGQALGQATVSFLVLFRAVAWRPTLGIRRCDLHQVRVFVSSVIGDRMVTLADERAPQVVIGLLLGPTAVGHFSIAIRLIDILNRVFVVPVNQVAMPAIARVQDDPERVRGLMAMGLAVGSIVSMPAFLGTSVIAPDVLPLVLGPAWLPAAPILQLLALRGLVWPAILQGHALLLGLGRPQQLVRIGLADLVVNLVTLGFAAPLGLAVVASVSSLRVVLLRWPLTALAAGRLVGLGLARQLGLLAPALLAGLLMAGVLLIARAYLELAFGAPALVASVIALGAVVYGLAILLLQPRLPEWLRQLGASLGRVEPAAAANA
jgi:PST family polysaccharide transporter